MKADIWPAVLYRIMPAEPVDLDDILVPEQADQCTSDWIMKRSVAAIPVSSKLWQRDVTRSYIGIRILQRPQDRAGLALRLAAIAIERGVIPILFTPLTNTGFERFGFRVERLPDASPEIQMAFETDLQQFWDMAIVIDLTDLEKLG